jgi:hypothetical protein
MDSEKIFVGILVVAVLGVGAYFILRSPPSATPDVSGAAGGFSAEGPQYLAAGGQAISGILGGVGNLLGSLGRQSNGAGAGAAKS